MSYGIEVYRRNNEELLSNEDGEYGVVDNAMILGLSQLELVL